jgi:hypothetical protein
MTQILRSLSLVLQKYGFPVPSASSPLFMYWVRLESKSLAIELQMPNVTDYDGDYAASLRRVGSCFVATMASASRLDADRLNSLYPEKVDLVRVLHHIELFSPGPGEPASVIEGLVNSTQLVFRRDVRDWVKESLCCTDQHPCNKVAPAATFT